MIIFTKFALLYSKPFFYSDIETQNALVVEW